MYQRYILLPEISAAHLFHTADSMEKGLEYLYNTQNEITCALRENLLLFDGFRHRMMNINFTSLKSQKV